MKIAILGPVTTNSYFGGVAIFDEELALGFKQNNCEVVLLTDQKDASSEKNGVRIRIVNQFNARKIIKEENPNVILASLAYPRYWGGCKKNITKIYFLHGFFFRRCHGKIKTELASLYQKHVTKGCNYVFANSYFTKMINEEFFCIDVDSIFHLGVSSEFAQQLKNNDICKEKNSIIYAGRLVSVKGVENLIDALKILKSRDVQFHAYIAGDGPDKERLQEIARKHDLNVSFLGRISQQELAKYYAKSEIFVSMNKSEPFGIVFLEALLSQCKIVCPYTGGQVEYLMDYGDTIEFVNETNPASIADGIESLFVNSNLNNIDDSLISKYSYKTVASRMLDFIEEHKSDK